MKRADIKWRSAIIQMAAAVIILFCMSCLYACHKAEPTEGGSIAADISKDLDSQQETLEEKQDAKPPVNKLPLSNALDNYSVEHLNIYTDATAQSYETARSAAEEAFLDPDITQDELDAAANSLEVAFFALEINLDESAYGNLVFKDVSRSPEAYEGSLVKCRGTVLQVQESEGETDLRLATAGYYDDVVFVGCDPAILDVRILEDDNITVYGIFIGLYSYTAVLGQDVTLPGIYATKIVINE